MAGAGLPQGRKPEENLRMDESGDSSILKLFTS
jgi:hypothetical protein